MRMGCAHGGALRVKEKGGVADAHTRRIPGSASERPSPERSHCPVYNFLEKTQLTQRKTVPWTPGDRGGVCGSSNGVAGAHLRGDEPVTYPDHNGGSTNLHIHEHAENCTSGEKLNCTIRNKVSK